MKPTCESRPVACARLTIPDPHLRDASVAQAVQRLESRLGQRLPPPAAGEPPVRLSQGAFVQRPCTRTLRITPTAHMMQG
jgi:hypothetical protein